MVSTNVIVAGFVDPARSYQALSALKGCHADGRIVLESAAVVERAADGGLRVADGADNVGPVGLATGSLIGMLVGVLGGPIGVLLGWGAGGLVGGAVDATRVVKSDDALTVLGRAIPPGSTAVIATVTEPAIEVVDGEMTRLGGQVTRRPLGEVVAELEVAEEAAEAAAHEARRTVREQRKAKLRANAEAKLSTAKEKLHIS